jgi:hypothetical protein
MQQKQNQNIRYLVVNQTDESWGLYITTIGFQSIASNAQYPPKEHPSSYWFKPQSGRKLQEFQLLYITSGEGVFESTHCKSTKISAGSILLLFPNEWHTYKPSKNSGWDEYWIGFKGEFIENLEQNSSAKTIQSSTLDSMNRSSPFSNRELKFPASRKLPTSKCWQVSQATSSPIFFM